jgi:hypothetical protein
MPSVQRTCLIQRRIKILRVSPRLQDNRSGPKWKRPCKYLLWSLLARLVQRSCHLVDLAMRSMSSFRNELPTIFGRTKLALGVCLRNWLCSSWRWVCCSKWKNDYWPELPSFSGPGRHIQQCDQLERRYWVQNSLAVWHLQLPLLLSCHRLFAESGPEELPSTCQPLRSIALQWEEHGLPIVPRACNESDIPEQLSKLFGKP